MSFRRINSIQGITLPMKSITMLLLLILLNSSTQFPLTPSQEAIMEDCLTSEVNLLPALEEMQLVSTGNNIEAFLSTFDQFSAAIQDVSQSCNLSALQIPKNKFKHTCQTILDYLSSAIRTPDDILSNNNYLSTLVTLVQYNDTLHELCMSISMFKQRQVLKERQNGQKGNRDNEEDIGELLYGNIDENAASDSDVIAKESKPLKCQINSKGLLMTIAGMFASIQRKNQTEFKNSVSSLYNWAFNLTKVCDSTAFVNLGNILKNQVYKKGNCQTDFDSLTDVVNEFMANPNDHSVFASSVLKILIMSNQLIKDCVFNGMLEQTFGIRRETSASDDL